MGKKFRGIEDPDGNVYEVETDENLEKSGVPADAAAVGNGLKTCLAKNQGSANVGKILVVGTDGNLVLTDMPEGGASGDVTGVLDESNNILLSGNLENGTYTLKWLNEDGTYSDAGTIEVGEIEPTKTNFADPSSSDWVSGRISNSANSGIANDVDSKVYTTNYIPVEIGDVIAVNNANTTGGTLVNARFAVYTGTEHSTRIYNGVYSSDNGYMNTVNDNEFEIANDTTRYVRFTLCDVTDVNAVTINIQRNGEWL